MYLDLVRPEPAVQRLQYRALHPAPADFTAIEWRVIRIARRDGPGSARARTRLGGWLRAILGLRATNPLADPRLEALRRVAVLLWHRRRSPSAREVDQLLAVGFVPAQVTLLTQLCAVLDY